MLRLISIRLIQAIPVMLAIYTITFIMVRLAPGNPFSSERDVPQHVLEQQQAYYGYNDPLLTQYARTLWQHITLDLPPLTSHPGLTSGHIIASSFPVSLELGILAFFFALALGLPAGIIAAARRGKWQDSAGMGLATTGICMPTFVTGPLLALVFGLWLQVLSTSGWFTWQDRILPAATLGIYYAAFIARLSRGSMLEALSQDYIRTARAKGCSERAVILRHALRGGIMPVISYLGPTLAGLVTGSVVVESIFQVPGLGRHFVQAAINRDHALILSTVLFYAAIILIANLLVDIIQIWLNPKTRAGAR